MSSLRTYVAILLLAASPAPAFTNSADQQLQFFATCAGRLSALMEHQWMHDTASADHTTALRKAMLELVFAVMPEGMGRAVLSMQVEAKHAQASLLRRSTTNKDPMDAEWAEARAAALTSECTGVLVVAEVS